MNRKDLINQIKSVKAVKPSGPWRQRNRDFLFNQITSAEPAVQPTADWQHYLRFFSFKVPQMVVRPAGIIVLVACIAFGSSIAIVKAAGGSMPGDILYNVKLANEKIESRLLTDPADNTMLELSFAHLRMKEMKQISEEVEPAKQKKAMAVATKTFRNNLEAVQNNLNTLKGQDDSAKTLGLADSVDGQINDFANTLKEGLSEGGEEDTQGANDVIKETGDKVIDVMVEKYNEGELSGNEKEEIVTKIKKKISGAREEIEELAQVLAELDIEVAVEEETTGTEEGETVEVEEKPAETVASMTVKTDKVKALLDEALELLIQGNLTPAVEKLRQAKDINAEIEAWIEEVTREPEPIMEEEVCDETAEDCKPIIEVNNQEDLNTNEETEESAEIEDDIEAAVVKEETDNLTN